MVNGWHWMAAPIGKFIGNFTLFPCMTDPRHWSSYASWPFESCTSEFGAEKCEKHVRTMSHKLWVKSYILGLLQSLLRWWVYQIQHAILGSTEDNHNNRTLIGLGNHGGPWMLGFASIPISFSQSQGRSTLVSIPIPIKHIKPHKIRSII